ncbi:hypothetical protein BHE74_00040040 [Ensete ventricosum]|nr:hypothetical protein BHE74_00040040 [Ensete ventricosum]
MVFQKNAIVLKFTRKSSFDHFFVHHPKNLKYWPFPTYSPWVSRTSMVLSKNATVINVAQS